MSNWREISVEFTPELQEEWKKLGFSYEECKGFVDNGLAADDAYFADYLRRCCNLEDLDQESIKRLKEIYTNNDMSQLGYSDIKNKPAQEWLDKEYSLEKWKDIPNLQISGEELEGSLNFANFINVNLIDLQCNNNLLTSLDVSKLVNLVKLDCSNNRLVGVLDLSNLTKLRKLDCSNNELTNILLPLDLEKLNLEEVKIDSNNIDYANLDKRFLKYLPTLATKSEIREIFRAEWRKIIQERFDIPGDIRNIQFFATWWNPNCTLVLNKIVWYAIRLVVYEPSKKQTPQVLKIIKISEHLYLEKAKEKMKKLQEILNGDNPILAVYSDTNFSPSDIIQRIDLQLEETDLNSPDKYLEPTDLVWRNMKIPILDCYHVAVYLGYGRVAHIGSSKFMKASKIKDNKRLLGARVDNWKDFLHSTNELRLIRYHPVIPFQRPEKIKENITKAVLAEYGAEEYSFLSNNCEHFATMCVCGIPFSTQADKIKLLANRVYLNLAQELAKNEQEFAKMSTSETFKEEIEKLRNYKSKEIEKLKSKGKLIEEEQLQLDRLKEQIKELKELWEQQYFQAPTAIIAKWNQIIRTKTNIKGTIEKIIPFPKNKNRVIVINKVLVYAVRLLEYDPQTQKLTELKRFAKNKVGYATLEKALKKVNKILESEKNVEEKLIPQIEIPTNK